MYIKDFLKNISSLFNFTAGSFNIRSLLLAVIIPILVLFTILAIEYNYLKQNYLLTVLISLISLISIMLIMVIIIFTQSKMMKTIDKIVENVLSYVSIVFKSLLSILFNLVPVTCSFISIILAMTIPIFAPFIVLIIKFDYLKENYLTIFILLMILIIVLFIFGRSKITELIITKINGHCLSTVKTVNLKEANISALKESEIHIYSAILKSFALLDKIDILPLRNSMKFVSILIIISFVLMYISVLVCSIIGLFIYTQLLSQIINF
jgi:hypothetical protein